jgi:hypothetical protein
MGQLMNIDPLIDEAPGIEQIPCDTWLDFRSRIYGNLFDHTDDERGPYEHGPYEPGTLERGRFIFRGHGSSNWKLVPTFDRWLPTVPKKEKPKIADELLDHFKKEFEGQADLAEEVLNSKHQMLGIAQHHGLPTRLLDWTESPYIAAFFAFSGLLSQKGEYWHQQEDQHVAVWALDTKRSIWSGNFGVEVIEVPPTSNYRMRNQTAKFTHMTAALYSSLEELVRQYHESNLDINWDIERPVLFKYVVPANEIRFALADLDLMGINYSRIFQDREGYALAAKMRIALKQVKNEYGW